MEDVNNEQSRAPYAVRQASDRAVRSLERYDFDIGGPLYMGKNIKAFDCGDVPGNMHDFAEHARRAEAAVRKILEAGALPLIIGGDHAIPIPVLRAFEGRGPITLVQIDAHIDWRDDFNGVRHGLSSPIRRASEMEHVERHLPDRHPRARAARGRRRSRPRSPMGRTSSPPGSCTTSAWTRSSTASRPAASTTSPSTPTAWTLP